MTTADNWGVEVEVNGQWEQFGPFVATNKAAKALALTAPARITRLLQMVPNAVLKLTPSVSA